MSVLQGSVAALGNKMPKVLSSKAHAIADYATIGTFFALAWIFWRRNTRAAISALICGGAELTTTLLTDFPGGVADVISLPTHIKIDYGLAAAASSMPSLMAFDDRPEAKWFRILGLNVTAVAALTGTRDGLRMGRRRKVA